MENLLKKIEDLREKFLETWKLLDIDRKKLKIEGRRLQINDPDFWNNREKAVEITREIDEREKEINEWDGLRSEIRSLEELVAMAQEENDDSLAQEVDKKYEELKNKYEKLEFLVLFSEKYDESNAIISVHAGTGGVDAQDWAEILERMFLRFAEKMNWKAEALDRTAGSEAGIKNTMIHIKGRWAYGYLKSESGVHRLVRISPFDAEAMRHTSFALVEVIPELPETVEIEISDSDLKVDVYRSSGPGGQSVNTTDSAVRMTHLPSGITVSCQNERSQHQNRETALKILKSKLHKLQIEEKEKEELKLKGEAQKAEWGKQIRSYVMQPYKMVKDHRTNHETQDIDGVLNGNLESFMEEYLRWIRK
ncbi:peptide chain release factor 2 [Candidatus Falkowbacteria bacterium RIFOXYB2_FULL_34_18]|uniref:Peptide chain release factor 2 n=1 Tax=Candidatus Falkowbacteria bacterium RIFOXYD2_FULL_34_120 TaxID=1798007 RepID=A0A1F5TRB8_9BACT|nr:MAG: peptide chain release factor 2 [Candidatus Falkowbacteria bacterium RIFOXYB2_FULL_34_18]OGF29958.1 MAG: peptide chain release factor 2 [Candidatus Falkowbacteria bacterium RIFOXYC12_FULL_34_55]OGF37184.1 MAG: peptide chain release factor 2 [Candidatus Falkowbacteria bacterium RIFOXYC2_FULL_34_220]OGF39496.1 MAG: peptide chain release factor 2 [Candidatus Falkowbacteria bacterium RIFOXYD12_FULL_34_57]OGF41522.1 MAG: peptide chain release factor 2 [Candidatus Falkowbacteria bacterium RIFO